MKKLKEEYQVWINFVDSTYWDDGSRYTNRKKTFKKKKDALSFIDEVKKKGYNYNGLGGQGFTHPDESKLSLIKVTETLLDF